MNMAGDRHICFTKQFSFPDGWANVKPDDLKPVFEAVCQSFANDRKVVFCCMSLEAGEKTGRPHIQGYVSFESPMLFSRVKKLLNDNTANCRAKAKKATHQDNYDYIFHEGRHKDKPGLLLPAWSFGTMPKETAGRPAGSGSVSDERYLKLMVGLKDGESLEELSQEYPDLFFRHFTHILKIREHFGYEDRVVLSMIKGERAEILGDIEV